MTREELGFAQEEAHAADAQHTVVDAVAAETGDQFIAAQVERAHD